MFGFPFVDHKTSAHKRPRPCANSMLFTVRYARNIPYIPSGRSEATRQKSDAIVREESNFLPPSPARRIFYERRNSEQVVVITGIFLRCLLSPPHVLVSVRIARRVWPSRNSRTLLIGFHKHTSNTSSTCKYNGSQEYTWK